MRHAWVPINWFPLSTQMVNSGPSLKILHIFLLHKSSELQISLHHTLSLKGDSSSVNLTEILRGFSSTSSSLSHFLSTSLLCEVSLYHFLFCWPVYVSLSLSAWEWKRSRAFAKTHGNKLEFPPTKLSLGKDISSYLAKPFGLVLLIPPSGLHPLRSCWALGIP